MKKNIEINLETPNGRLRLIRLALGISQKELAELSSIPLSTINKIEQNKFSLNPDNAHKLSKALKLEESWIMNGYGETFFGKAVFFDFTDREIKNKLDYFLKVGTVTGKSIVNAYLIFVLLLGKSIYFIKTLSYDVDNIKQINDAPEFDCGEDFLLYFQNKDADIKDLQNKLLTLDPHKKILLGFTNLQSNEIICKSTIFSSKKLTDKGLLTLIAQENLDIQKVHELIKKNLFNLRRPS